MNTDDQHIISLLQNKNAKAIELIYDRWAGSLYGLILNIVKDEEIAQDTLQEVMVKVWKKGHLYDASKSKLFTWVYQITRNSAVDAYRKIKKRPTEKIQQDASFVSAYKSESMLQSNELKQKINSLEPKYKEVIQSLFFDGLTQREMSEQTGIPLGTIKTRLRIAMRELRHLYHEPSFIAILLILGHG